MKTSRSLLAFLMVFAALALIDCGGGGGGGGSDPGSSAAAAAPESSGSLPFSETQVPTTLQGKIIMSINDGATWQAYSLDAASRSLTSYPSAAYSAVGASPLGGYYAFADASGSSVLYDRTGNLVGTGAGSPRHTEKTAQTDQYAWAPDDKALYYGVYYDGLYRIDTQTGTSVQVVKSIDFSQQQTVFDHSIAVSPDNAYFVWFHHELGYYPNVYVMDHSKLNDPSKLPLSYDEATLVAPWGFKEDGKTVKDQTVYDEDAYPVFIDDTTMVIAFTTFDSGFANSSTKLFTLDAATGSVVLHGTVSAGWVYSMSLSPDRSTLLICGSRQLCIVDVATWRPTLVDDLTGYSVNRGAAWSPDGRYFAVLTAGVEGTNLVQVLLYEPASLSKWKLHEVPGATAAGSISWLK